MGGRHAHLSFWRLGLRNNARMRVSIRDGKCSTLPSSVPDQGILPTAKRGLKAVPRGNPVEFPASLSSVGVDNWLREAKIKPEFFDRNYDIAITRTRVKRALSSRFLKGASGNAVRVPPPPVFGKSFRCNLQLQAQKGHNSLEKGKSRGPFQRSRTIRCYPPGLPG